MRTAIQESTAPNEAIIARGNRIYEEQLKERLETEHRGRFVAIDPESGDYFLGDTDTQAALAALKAIPGGRFFIRRIGYEVTHRLGSYGLNRRQSD